MAGLACLAACGRDSGRPNGTTASAGGAVELNSPPPRSAGTREAGVENAPSAASNLTAPAENEVPAEHAGRMGRIPIFEYHIIGDSAKGQFVITREQFRRDLQILYDRGYRPITVAQLLDRDFRDVPVGMSPVVFTFDDASPGQFSYIERDGKLEIDPTSALGIWLEFQKTRPDWKNRATFCLLSAAEEGHSFFGDKPKFRGQKKEWRPLKLKWLAENGFELCNHTLYHARLDKHPDAFVQEQIARGQLAIDSMVPSYRVRTFALPLGKYPKNRELAWRGSWTDPSTGRTVTYDYETVLEVAGGPVRSPFDPEFNRRRLKRVIAFENQVEKILDELDASKTRFVWDGEAASTLAR